MILSVNNPQLAAKLDLHILYKQRNKAEQSTCPTSLANRESSWTVRQPAWWSLLSCSAATKEFTMANIVARSATSSSARQASVLRNLDPTTSFSSDFSIKRAKNFLITPLLQFSQYKGHKNFLISPLLLNSQYKGQNNFPILPPLLPICPGWLLSVAALPWLKKF